MEKRLYYTLLSLLVIIIATLIVIAAPNNGHDASAIDFSQQITQPVRINNDVSITGKITATEVEGAIPPGAIMYFNRATCPQGWNAVPNTYGRYIVGLSPTGTLQGLVGTPLGNNQDRPVGLHSHHVDPPPGVDTTPSGGHNHGVYWHAGYHGGGIHGAGGGDSASTVHGGVTSPVGHHIHQVDIPRFRSYDSDGEGATAGTNAPYVQFLACEKT
tara:strand:- start:4259 stop:4903 length:645 start_codon:yes stop_codon:yes gene_type:complete